MLSSYSAASSWLNLSEVCCQAIGYIYLSFFSWSLPKQQIFVRTKNTEVRNARILYISSRADHLTISCLFLMTHEHHIISFVLFHPIHPISAASKAYLLSGSSVRSEDLAKSKNQKENLLKSNKSIQKVQLFQQAFMSNVLSDLWPITWPMLSQAMYSLKLWPSILLGSLKAIPLFLLFLKFISNHESGLFSWNF